jgi:hypothetical protein
LLEIDNNLIGYTLLRKRTFTIKANSKNFRERERERERESIGCLILI